MRSNSERVVKWYSRPFSSDPRGSRVVNDTEKSRPSTSLRTSPTSVDFPEPLGAEMMKRIPPMLSLRSPSSLRGAFHARQLHYIIRVFHPGLFAKLQVVEP